ncbi:MAG: 50S ribosomal protein L29 [Thermodesulfobacteriota bacterium]|nr:50S ribosomal protein L29 [Thermodesulfobacteriota bacterium]
MKSKELRELSVQELMDKEIELAKGLFNLRFQMATGQLNTHTSIRKTKKDIARVKTVIKERELENSRAGA